MNVQEWELAWLAGIIDGEGGFSIAGRYSGAKTSCHISNTNPLIIDKCKEILNNIFVQYSIHKQNGPLSTRTVSRIEVTQRPEILKLISVVLPFLVGKKQQAELIRKYTNRRLTKAHKAPYDDIELSLIEQICILNSGDTRRTQK